MRDKQKPLIVYSTVLLLLSVFLVGSMLLPRWQEKQRQQKIALITAQARQVSGLTLDAATQRFSSVAPSLAILYTGDTRSYLEPCGCYAGQAGGLARRAMAVKRLRAFGVPSLLVDTGGIFPCWWTRGASSMAKPPWIGFGARLTCAGWRKLATMRYC